MITLFYIINILIASLLGMVEGALFVNTNISKLWRSKFKFDIHILFTVLRALILFCSTMVIYLNKGYLMALFYALAVVMMFSFFHNGFYYLTRKKLDGAYNSFFSQSTTTTAKTSLNAYQRTILFLLSLIILLF